MQQTSPIKDECLYKVIAICHSEQNIQTVEIKCGDYNHPATIARALITYQRAVMTNNMKLKIATQP